MADLKQFYADNADRINGIAKANNVDTGTAQAMLISNIKGNSNYAGGGVADMNQLRKAYENALSGSNTTKSYYDTASDTINSQYKNLANKVNSNTDYAINQLNNQKTELQKAYEEQQKQNYINNELAKKNLNDYLTAMGYTGGMAETSALNLANNYQNNYATAQNNYNDQLANIDEQIAQARLNGNNSLADIENQRYSALLNAQNEQASYENQLAENDYAQRKWEAEMQADEEKRQQETALKIVQMWGNGQISGAQAQEMLRGTPYEGTITETGYNPSKIKTSSGSGNTSSLSNSQALSIYKMYVNGELSGDEALPLLAGTPYENNVYQSSLDTDWNKDLTDAQSGRMTPATVYDNRSYLVAKYGEDKYKQLLNASYLSVY